MRPQRDLGSGNSVWQQECDAWVYCVGSITVDRPNFLVREQTDCAEGGHEVSAED